MRPATGTQALHAFAVGAFLLAGGPAGAQGAAPGPLRVSVGAYLHDVQALDLKSHSYNVDLYVWFKWRGSQADPSETMEFMNPTELWGHVRSKAYETPVRLPTGERYQLLRVMGRFSRKLPLYDYPFDRQTLTVEFEDSHRAADQLQYEAAGVSVNPKLELPGFVLGVPLLEVDTSPYPTDFGDPEGSHAFSRARITLPVARPLFPYTVKLLLPILCVILCAALMFLLHPRHVDARVGIGITALLTIVALQITLNDDLPETAYLVLMDKIYLGAYLYVIAGLGVIVRTTWMLEHRDVGRALELDRRGLALLSAVYLLATAVLIGASL